MLDWHKSVEPTSDHVHFFRRFRQFKQPLRPRAAKLMGGLSGQEGNIPTWEQINACSRVNQKSTMVWGTERGI